MSAGTMAPATTPAAHLLGGRRVETTGSERIAVLNPATGREVGSIPAGTEADADAAVAAARAGAPGWARTPAAERGATLRAAAATLREHVDEIARLQSAEGGKPLADSRAGVEAGIGAFEQCAELGPLHGGRTLAGGWGAIDLMAPEPRGVVLALVPWNDPVAIACGVVAAALATGNSVILKPSERTPLSSLRMAELLDLPDGVLNVALGDARVGRPLVLHPGVDCVVHVGSVATGREIGAACGRALKKAVLELGGKDPLIVDAGVDVAWAADQAASGAFANAGQVCTSVERIYAHRDVAADLADALRDRATALRLGGPEDSATTMGPMIDDRQRRVVTAHVDGALAAGARLVTGGEVPAGAGFFYPPTVLAGVADTTALMREETFGPVAAIRAVDSFDEALALAGAGDYGLAATVLTPSQAHAQRAFRELPVGTVKVNAVWGGAPGGSAEPRGTSGLGHGYGPGLLDELTAIKVLHLTPAPESCS